MRVSPANQLHCFGLQLVTVALALLCKSAQRSVNQFSTCCRCRLKRPSDSGRLSRAREGAGTPAPVLPAAVQDGGAALRTQVKIPFWEAAK